MSLLCSSFTIFSILVLINFFSPPSRAWRELNEHIISIFMELGREGGNILGEREVIMGNQHLGFSAGEKDTFFVLDDDDNILLVLFTE